MTSGVQPSPSQVGLCTTCLSKSRTIRPLNGDRLISVYRELLRCDTYDAAISLCWECEAFLQRCVRFRQRAERARAVLRHLSLQHRLDTELSTLSTLQTNVKRKYDFTLKYGEEPNAAVSRARNDEEYPINVFKLEPEVMLTVKRESPQPASHYSSDDSEDSENEPLAGKASKKAQETSSSQSSEKEASAARAPGVCVRMMKEQAMRERRHEMRRDSDYRSKPYLCHKCIVGFLTPDEYSDHLELVHTPKPGHMQCAVCEGYVERVLLEVHVRKHYATFACTHCHYNHYREELVQWHVKSCEGRPPPPAVVADSDGAQHPCDQCSKVFKSRAHMKAHVVRQHSGPRACDKCGKVLPTTQALWLHMQMEHKEREMKPCPTCGKKLPGAFKLKQHMRVHRQDPRGVAPHRCAPCNKIFMSERAYRVHLTSTARHNTERELKFKCSACERAFAFKGALYSHYSHYHKKATMLQCQLCDRVLATAASLKRHTERVHEGVREKKDRVCDVCGKYFSASQLKQHMLIHREERPYACKVCGATFRQRPALYTHNRLVHLHVRRSRAAAVATSAAPSHDLAF